MLSNLSIKSLTLVDALALDFSPGMSVVTGETGAGKSIMVGALGLAIGDRADSRLIANRMERAEISASFELSEADKEARLWLSERALDDGDFCIVRRVLTTDGRSRAFVNGSAVSISDLRALGEKLLDIHSQHEHQRLLKRESHRKLLDEFGGLHRQVAALNEQFEAFASTRDQLENLAGNRTEQDALVQLLTYQFEELSTLAVKEGEARALEAEHKRLTGAEENRRNIIDAFSLCEGDDDNTVSNLLNRALSCLGDVDDDRISGPRELLTTALIQVEEAAKDLASSLDRFESDPQRLSRVENRLGKIYEVARKHRVEPDSLSALTARVARKLHSIESSNERIAELEEHLPAIRTSYATLAAKLSKARKKAAGELEQAVTGHLRNLGMTDARLFVRVECLDDGKPRRFGMDDIEFLVSTIPGAEPGALNKIVSGGELSRISLAIQVVTARTSDTPTLVFDEVDVGVGGGAAEVIGNLLRQLGKETQVLCVTHLPQVAAQGNHHYVVTRSKTDGSATTSVRKLDEAARVSEIARMLGGVEQTAESLAHAESMRAGVAP